MMTPLDDFAYLINHVLLGEEPTVEDFILLVGTMVAFIAFILWCCFPIVPKDSPPTSNSVVHSSINQAGPAHYDRFSNSNRSHHTYNQHHLHHRKDAIVKNCRKRI